MLDIYIGEKESSSYDQLKNLCVGYLIRKNYDVDIYVYSPSEITDSAAIYMLSFDDDTEKLSRMVRSVNSGSYVIVLVDGVDKLKKAVTPGICPSGIVIKPWNKDDIDTVLDEVYSDYLRSSDSGRLGMFTFKLKAKEFSIPYERILFFESRNKKVIVRTETQELECYNTLDSVLSAAPDCFMKIHKSFVVNTSRIVATDYGAMTVEFDDGSAAFMSRTYKAELREKLNARSEK